MFWRNTEGHIEDPGTLTRSVTVSTGALISAGIVIVILASPISRYTDATAAQLLDTDQYTDILKTQMVGEGN